MFWVFVSPFAVAITTFFTPFSPGGIGALGHSGTVQPQDPLAFELIHLKQDKSQLHRFCFDLRASLFFDILLCCFEHLVQNKVSF